MKTLSVMVTLLLQVTQIEVEEGIWLIWLFTILMQQGNYYLRSRETQEGKEERKDYDVVIF